MRKEDIIDEVNIQAFIAGDDTAFTFIYNSYVDVLLSYGIGMGFEKEMLKDAIQDVFIKLYANRQQLSEVKKLKFYLFRSLKNRLLDMLKASVDTSDINLYEFKFSVKTTILDELMEEEDKTEVQHKIEQLLDCLTDRQREIIYLRFIQELEYEEIAVLLDITPHASRKLVSRAMKKIREENLMFYLMILILSHLYGS